MTNLKTSKEEDELNERIYNQSMMLHKTIESFLAKLFKLVKKSKNKIVSETSLFNELGYKIPYIIILQLIHGLSRQGIDINQGRSMALNINEQILIGMLISCKGSGMDIDEVFRSTKAILDDQGSKIREDYEKDLSMTFEKLGI